MAKGTAKSIEEKIEDITKQQLERFGVKYHIKTDNINEEINHALTNLSLFVTAQKISNFTFLKIK